MLHGRALINPYNGAAINKKGIFNRFSLLFFAPRPKIGATSIPELLILGALPFAYFQEHLFMTPSLSNVVWVGCCTSGLDPSLTFLKNILLFKTLLQSFCTCLQPLLTPFDIFCQKEIAQPTKY